MLKCEDGPHASLSRYKYKDIQLPQLRSFCLAAAEGNFTAAAAVLGLSVSAAWLPVLGARIHG